MKLVGPRKQAEWDSCGLRPNTLLHFAVPRNSVGEDYELKQSDKVSLGKAQPWERVCWSAGDGSQALAPALQRVNGQKWSPFFLKKKNHQTSLPNQRRFSWCPCSV